MAKKSKYQLPEFNQEKLLQHIQSLVDKAPGGVVQLVIDLFCGAGGTSEGIEQARYRGIKNSVVIAGINHDKKAIYSQAVNHPLAYYTDEDIRFANLKPIADLVTLLRKLFPQCPILIWASLECTNHSNAKGGMARDPDSRTLPWDLYRYIETLNPDGIWIENVKEFAEWGPMMERIVLEKGETRKSLKNPIPRHLEDEFYADKIAKGFTAYCPLEWLKDGQKKKTGEFRPEWVPIRDLKGIYYLDWKKKVDAYGYHNQQRIINAADHGAPTNRKRLFLLFMRTGWPITFPHPTHAKKPKEGDLFDPYLKPHVPVKTCLDFSVEGRSVFEDGHVDSIKTWERLYEGLIKFVAGGEDAYYLMKYNSSHNNTSVNKGASINEPSPTITTMSGVALIKTDFIDVIYGKGYASSMEDAAPTVRTKDGMALVNPNFFLVNQQGQSTANSVDQPSPTLLTKEKLSLVGVKHFIYKAFSNSGYHGSIDEPEGTVLTNPKSALVQVDGYVMSTNYDNIGSALNEPAHTITANRKWSYLINPSWFGSLGSTDKPAVTIVARQDKAPIYLLSVSETQYSLAIPVFETDPEIVVKIKEFMALYNIYDIKKRMLMVPELLQIQSFPKDYFLAGTKTDQKKFIGNAVPPVVARAIAESMYLPLVEHICKTLNIQLKLAA